jgi:hypothetical protein
MLLGMDDVHQNGMQHLHEVSDCIAAITSLTRQEYEDCNVRGTPFSNR